MPPSERIAMRRVIELLEREGDALAFPYTGHIEGVERLRELRSRAGHSPWRAFYRRIGAAMWVGAFGSHGDAVGFARAIRDAEERLARVERGEEH